MFCDIWNPRPITRTTTLDGAFVGILAWPDTTTRSTNCWCWVPPGFETMIVPYLDADPSVRAAYVVGGLNQFLVHGAPDSEGLDPAPPGVGWAPGAYARVTVTY